MDSKKIYFASDFHLGAPTYEASRVRELRIVRWLEYIRTDAKAIYLVGDVFDFWFEYKTVVPRGYVRLLGKLAELRDAGIRIYFFTGNHDMWMFRYFEEELDIPIYRAPIQCTLGEKRFFIGHGDGLGPGDKGYKFIKKVFSNRLCQWLFARLHPNFGIGLAQFWSGRSRQGNEKSPDEFTTPEREWLYQYANRKLDTEYYDFFIFGHRHIPLDLMLKNEVSRYINLGEWMTHNSYAVFDGEKLELKYFLDERDERREMRDFQSFK